MKFIEKNPVRKFTVGINGDIIISDYGDIFLSSDEQVTFKTKDHREYDVSRKDWGYYATPSLNSRLKKFNLRGVLIKNINTNNFFVLLVESGKEEFFEKYLKEEQLKIVTWLDNNESLERFEKCVEEESNGK